MQLTILHSSTTWRPTTSGRYNALSAGAFSLAAIVPPAIAGWLIGHSLGSAYIAMLAAGCAAVVWVASVWRRGCRQA